ncbi:hypothetical protein [Clostridium sp. J1101437_171009_A5]|uniref:hypothetical protein n=1 Tax=Clostridium sp. J1101437_171009_A5 TaxID=2787098 RepID=UPI00189885B5|nr:hypothetical protein [Clostridium sp. J1101437_171009_A5]
MAQIHWDSLIQIRPNTMGELAKVTPFGRLSLTRTILEKFPDRKATVFLSSDGKSLYLAAKQSHPVAFPQKACHTKVDELYCSLEAMGFSFPVSYHMEWDEENLAWVGNCVAGDPPPHPAEVAKKQGSRTKRRSSPAGSQDEGKVL